MRRLIFLTGVLLLLYPFAGAVYTAWRTERAVSVYEAALSDEEAQDALEAAAAYNTRHAAFGVQPSALSEELSDYTALLDADGSGMMGTVEIPALGLVVPVYHGTDAAALSKGAGHMEGTSLPAGGENTHTVIAAHTGLAGSELFTRLDRLCEGDVFYLNIFGERMCYKVDQILTVEPEDTDALRIVEGGDYATLLTCTPYGINSHRLLVRGVRTEDNGESVSAEDALSVRSAYFAGMLVLTAAVPLILCYVKKRIRRRL